MLYLQFLINGLIAGSIYALVAIGFSLIYATNRFVHFAHGAVVAVGAFFMYSLFRIAGLPFYVAAFLAIILTALLGGSIFYVLYNPLQKKKASTAVLLIASLALAMVLENVLLLIFDARVRSFEYLDVQKGIDVFGAYITPLQIAIIVIALLLLLAVWLFVRFSRFGRYIRAVADNPTLADISGIHSRKVKAWSFVIASGIAGFAGIMIGLEQNIQPLMGLDLIIKGFTGAVIGGVGSLPGSVLGSYLLGIVENMGIIWLPSAYKEAIAFILLLLFLLLRPQGILGINKGVRK